MSYRKFVLPLSFMLFACAFFLINESRVDAQNEQISAFTSPIKPTLTSTPMPSLSPFAKVAIEYIAKQYSISTVDLQVANEEPVIFPLIGRKFVSLTVWTIPPTPFREFMLLVDQSSNQVEINVNAIKAQEQIAYRTKYGKLHPDLYDKLQNMREDELATIAIWLLPRDDTRSQEERYTLLTAKYPEAQAAIEKRGVPWGVEDKDLSERIYRDYVQILTEDSTQQTQPLVKDLKELGVTDITTFDGMPSIAARLPKQAIKKIENREDVDLVYLIEENSVESLLEAIPTDRVPASWYQGSLSGTGRKIAILEPFYIAQDTNCLNIIATRTVPTPVPPYEYSHKTWVSSVAACNHSTYRGMAYNAGLIDAAFDQSQPYGQPDFATAVAWSVLTQAADVVNASVRMGADQASQWPDRVLDYWARTVSVVIVVAGGNTDVSTNIASPGKGWNVISVGGIDDHGNTVWSDDTPAGIASYVNPNFGIEKPDVVAPAVNITMLGPAATPATRSGTSLAAPQVSGMAALLMNTHSELIDRPEAIKAIIMASAIHNVDGSRVMPTGQDLLDGAGAIDVNVAVQIAATGYPANNITTCDKPCWWATDFISISPDAYIDRTMQLIRGERARVAIAWWGKVDASYATTSLASNFNLQILAPSGSQVGISSSTYNSTELTEFVATETGQYTIRIRRHYNDTNANESQNEIGIAWMKQATYLPDIRRDATAWQSTLFVHNEDPTDQLSEITWCRHIGSPNVGCDLGDNPTIGGGDLYNFTAPFANVQDSGTVDGSESLSVISRIFNSSSNMETLDNGYRTSLGDPAFEQSGTTLYIPAFYKDVFSANSQVYIQNKSTSAATLQVEFIGRAGYSNYTVNPGSTIPSNGVWYAVGSLIPPSNWVGSLKLTANQPIIAKAYETVPNMARSFNGTAIGNKLLYVPAAYKNYGGLTTGLIIQNLGGSQTNVQLTFCFQPTDPSDAAQCPVDSSITNLQPNQAAGINLGSINLPPVVDGWRGSIKIQSVANQPLAAVVNNVRKDGSGNTIGGYSFNASNYGGRLVVLPYAACNSGGRPTGFTLRNVHTAAVDVTVRYYNSDGTLRWTRPTFTLQRAWSNGYHQNSGDDAINLPDPWQGSIVLQATGPILVIMREDKASADVVSGYNGIVLSP